MTIDDLARRLRDVFGTQPMTNAFVDPLEGENLETCQKRQVARGVDADRAGHVCEKFQEAIAAAGAQTEAPYDASPEGLAWIRKFKADLIAEEAETERYDTPNDSFTALVALRRGDV